jgi:hypothetical protein
MAKIPRESRTYGGLGAGNILGGAWSATYDREQTFCFAATAYRNERILSKTPAFAGAFRFRL